MQKQALGMSSILPEGTEEEELTYTLKAVCQSKILTDESC